MRTSLNNIRQTEDYLKGQMEPVEALLFKARLLTNPLLRMNVRLQQKAYSLISFFHRNQLKQEVNAVHEQLFNDPEKEAFRQQISHIFNP
jgi:hypothetical protein